MLFPTGSVSVPSILTYTPTHPRVSAWEHPGICVTHSLHQRGRPSFLDSAGADSGTKIRGASSFIWEVVPGSFCSRDGKRRKARQGVLTSEVATGAQPTPQSSPSPPGSKLELYSPPPFLSLGEGHFWGQDLSKTLTSPWEDVMCSCRKERFQESCRCSQYLAFGMWKRVQVTWVWHNQMHTAIPSMIVPPCLSFCPYFTFISFTADTSTCYRFQIQKWTYSFSFLVVPPEQHLAHSRHCMNTYEINE